MSARLQLDTTNGRLTDGVSAANLTKQQSAFVALLATATGRAVTTEQAIRHLWPDEEPDCADRSLKVLVCHVRAKLAASLLPPAITTASGRGYGWNYPTEIVGGPIIVPTHQVADLRRLLATHPNRRLADLVGWGVFGEAVSA